MTTDRYMAEHGHGHTHGHTHGHGHGHGHGQGFGVNRRRVFLALCLTGVFTVVEVIGGIVSGSLALLADAAHMLIDTLALFLTWFAFGLRGKPADNERTYGYHRFPILAAYTNGISMVFIVGWIAVEAVQRLHEPVEILAGPMLVVAVIGLMVNVVAGAILFGADRENLNIRGAFLHVLGDLLGSAAAIAAAIVILVSGWTMIDPLLSFLVAALIFRSTWFLIRDAGHVLLEGTPNHLDVREIGSDLVENLDENRGRAPRPCVVAGAGSLAAHAACQNQGGGPCRLRHRCHSPPPRGALQRDALDRADRDRVLRR